MTRARLAPAVNFLRPDARVRKAIRSILSYIRPVMSLLAELGSTSGPVVLLLDFEGASGALEASLAPALPEPTRARIAAFSHPVRRRQTFWGRILACAAARALGARLVEDPPYAPYLLKDGCRTALCVAHTGTSIALGIASKADPVMGLDLETLRPVRSIEGMARMSFGDAARAVIAECEACASAEPFFRAWGMKESEIKLNRGGRGHRLTLDGCGRPVVLDPVGRPLLAAHEAFGALRLTVLTSLERPRVLQTTPDAVERVLRIASPAA